MLATQIRSELAPAMTGTGITNSSKLNAAHFTKSKPTAHPLSRRPMTSSSLTAVTFYQRMHVISRYLYPHVSLMIVVRGLRLDNIMSATCF